MSDSIRLSATAPLVAATDTTSADRQGQNPQAPTPAPAPQTATPPPTAEQAVRLVIEPVGDGADYTYKLFDRVTGELLIELPREQAAKLGASPDYSAGQVYDSKA